MPSPGDPTEIKDLGSMSLELVRTPKGSAHNTGDFHLVRLLDPNLTEVSMIPNDSWLLGVQHNAQPELWPINK